MYPVSEAYKNAIAQNNRNVRIMGTITLRDNTVINISDEDILQGSLYFTEQCVSGEDIEIGNVYASELGLTLTSPPENPYSLDGARIIINFGINVEPDPEEDPLWEYVPLGYFYVTEIERKHTAVSLKALDGMILFDVDLSGVLTTGTPYSLIQSCCTKAGVTLATSYATFATFANGTSSFALPADSKIETCRDLIMWVCQITGTFARMNRMGQLEIVPVTAGASVKTISKQERFTSDVSDFEVKITQVNMKIGETEYSQGTAGMTMVLEENPLLAGKSEAEINAALAEILDQVTEAEYTPYNLTCAGDPALQAGDWVKLTGVSNINGPEFVYTRNSVAYHPDTGEEIPEDTPVFVDFVAGKKGSLMCEGTENMFTNPRFENGGNGWTVSGSATVDNTESIAKLSKPAVAHDGFYQNFPSLVEGDTYLIRYRVKYISGSVRFGGHMGPAQTGTNGFMRVRIDEGSWMGWQNYIDVPNDGNFHNVDILITVGTGYTDNRIFVQPGRQEAIATEFYVEYVQFEHKSYPTPFQIGTRAAPLKRITLPEPLPATFGIGIAAKMLHAHDTATRTFWQAGDYRCYFDAADNKIKLTNGVVTAETATVSWSEDDYVGIYAGRENGNLFLQAKIAGALTDRVEAEAGAGTGETLYVGSRADGSESVNAVVADLVFHDRPEDIDPEGYLSAIPGGGGE